MARASEPITVRVEAGIIGRIVIDVPRRRNALSREVLDGIREGISDLTSGGRTRVIVLTGEGGTFSSGGDMKEQVPIEDTVGAAMRLYRALWSSSVPVIARIEGHCLGLALGVAAACDLAVAVRGTTFALPEVRMGQVPTIASLSVVPRLRPADASRLLLTGAAFDGDHAAAIGLVNASVSPGDLDHVVDEWASELLAGGPEAIGMCKKLLRVGRCASEEAFALASAMAFDLAQSPEAREGVAASAARRPPRWQPSHPVVAKSNTEGK